MLLDYY